MTRERPAIVTVFGVLHLIFGILGLITGLIGLVMSGGGGMGGGVDAKELENAITQSFPSYATFDGIHKALSLIFPVILLAAGVLLLQSNAKGRLLSIVYALATIAWSAVFIYVFAVFVIPALEPFIDKAMTEQMEKQAQQAGGKMDPQAREMAKNIGKMGAYGGLCCPLVGMVYPLIVLVCMFLPSMRSLGHGGPREVLPGPEELQPPDDGWGRQ